MWGLYDWCDSGPRLTTVLVRLLTLSCTKQRMLMLQCRCKCLRYFARSSRQGSSTWQRAMICASEKRRGECPGAVARSVSVSSAAMPAHSRTSKRGHAGFKGDTIQFCSWRPATSLAVLRGGAPAPRAMLPCNRGVIANLLGFAIESCIRCACMPM